MATTCPVDLDTARLRHEIRAIYARVASDPMSAFHFRRGPAYAAERLGYDYADIIVASELSESIRRDIDLWTG